MSPSKIGCNLLLVAALIVMSSELAKGEDFINWALFRPAYQSTTYTQGSTPLEAKFAVDDQKNPDLVATLACTHTQEGNALLKSWWAVDMGRQIKVSHVIIIGRNGGAADRLANFMVGTTNFDPRIVPPVSGILNIMTPPPGVLSVCAYKGPYTDYRLDLYCTQASQDGRFLVVQYTDVSNFLSLCEVQVYGEPV